MRLTLLHETYLALILWAFQHRRFKIRWSWEYGLSTSIDVTSKYFVKMSNLF